VLAAMCAVGGAVGQEAVGKYELALENLARLYSTDRAAIEAAALAEAKGDAQAATNKVLAAGERYVSYRAGLEKSAAMAREAAEEFLVAGRVLPGISAADFAQICQSTDASFALPGAIGFGDPIKAVLAPYGEKFKESPHYLAACFDKTQDLRFLNRLSQVFVQKTAKRLRQEGKSIVTVGGVNPLVVETKPLFDALNSPMLNGLEAAYRTVTGDTEVPTIGQQGKQAALEKVYQDVNDGTILHPKKNELQDIRFLLGTDAFNAWAKTYNEGSAK
jgi:hypothetical protein